jgi:hypothetical protein
MVTPRLGVDLLFARGDGIDYLDLADVTAQPLGIPSDQFFVADEDRACNAFISDDAACPDDFRVFTFGECDPLGILDGFVHHHPDDFLRLAEKYFEPLFILIHINLDPGNP